VESIVLLPRSGSGFNGFPACRPVFTHTGRTLIRPARGSICWKLYSPGSRISKSSFRLTLRARAFVSD